MNRKQISDFLDVFITLGVLPFGLALSIVFFLLSICMINGNPLMLFSWWGFWVIVFFEYLLLLWLFFLPKEVKE